MDKQAVQSNSNVSKHFYCQRKSSMQVVLKVTLIAVVHFLNLAAASDSYI